MIYFCKCISFIVATDFKQFVILGSLSGFTSFCNVYVRKFSPTTLLQVLLWLLHISFQHTKHFIISASFLWCRCYLSLLSKCARKTSIHPAGSDLNTTWASILHARSVYTSLSRSNFLLPIYFSSYHFVKTSSIFMICSISNFRSVTRSYL